MGELIHPGGRRKIPRFSAEYHEFKRVCIFPSLFPAHHFQLAAVLFALKCAMRGVSLRSTHANKMSRLRTRVANRVSTSIHAYSCGSYSRYYRAGHPGRNTPSLHPRTRFGADYAEVIVEWFQSRDNSSLIDSNFFDPPSALSSDA